jgi:alpha-ketoglutarate-dependent taurine dioxygenase
MNDRNVSATARSPVGIRPFGGLLGAEVTGVDAATDTSGVMPTIWEAFTRHRLVVLRNQQLTDQQIYEFAQRFGPVEKNKNRDATGTVFGDVHSITNLDADGNPSRRPGVNENYYWHSDKAHEAVPCLLTMLYAVEIPPTGGDTEFAAMEAAYDALDPETKARIENLTVEHSWGYMRETITGRPPTDEEKLKSPPVVHPLVRVHPDTGRKSLYLGMYCRRIIDSPDKDEGRTLLKQLTEHATQPRFIFTHKWQPRDLIFWDNRCLMHRAIQNFDLGAHRRVLRRVVVKGKPEWIARQP